MESSGRLITIEGIDGAGKTTLQSGLTAALGQRGIDVRALREPGGVGGALGEQCRRERTGGIGLARTGWALEEIGVRGFGAALQHGAQHRQRVRMMLERGHAR